MNKNKSNPSTLPQLNKGLSQYPITKIIDGISTTVNDHIAVESVLQIKISHGKGQSRSVNDFAIVLRTPGKDRDLINGLLYTEGIISKHDDILSLREELNPNNEKEAKTVHVELNPNLQIDPNLFKRNTLSNSSCGLCGKQTLDMMTNCVYPLLPKHSIGCTVSEIIDFKNILTNNQTLFSTTGGSHASVIIDTSSQVLALCEDVGRHNAMDKVIGQLLTKKLLLNNSPYYIGLVSGRVSYELVHKALLARVAILIALGAPSSLAIEMAEENGLTLIGFLKKGSFNVYSHKERVRVSG